jgi:hypothetical protein
MLLGYNEKGEIEFMFTDEAYLTKQFPNNSAKITNFWGTAGSHLKELFIDIPQPFEPKSYKVIEGKLIKLTSSEIKKESSSIIIETAENKPKEISV